jgi:hypothetical protein
MRSFTAEAQRRRAAKQQKKSRGEGQKAKVESQKPNVHRFLPPKKPETAYGDDADQFFPRRSLKSAGGDDTPSLPNTGLRSKKLGGAVRADSEESRPAHFHELCEILPSLSSGPPAAPQHDSAYEFSATCSAPPFLTSKVSLLDPNRVTVRRRN